MVQRRGNILEAVTEQSPCKPQDGIDEEELNSCFV